MSKRFQFVRDLFNSMFRIKQRTTFIGTDEYGNKYFEKLGDRAHNIRGSRWVEPSTNPVNQIQPEVPPAWDAWLRNKRFSPPTQEELDKNYMTMMRTQARARELEENERLARYSEDEERKKVDANLGDFVKNVTGETGKKEFPKFEDFEGKPGVHKDKIDR